MDQKQFAITMEKMLQESLGKNAVLQKIVTDKPNGVKKDGLFLGHKYTCASPVIYPSEFYEEYQNGTGMEECVQAALELLKGNACSPDIGIEGNFIRNIRKWNVVQDKVYPYLINHDANTDLLKNMPYQPYLDLAVCCYLGITDGQGGLASVKISKQLLELWGISETELFEQAYRNMMYEGYQFMDMRKILSEMEMLPEDVTDGMVDRRLFSILTNRKKTFGAAGMLRTELLAAYAGQEGTNLYLIPSSIHEILAIPDDGGMAPQELEKMIREVNATQLKPEEVLSDHAYYFDRETGEVKIAE